MSHRFLTLVPLVMILLGACASAPTSTSFDPRGQNALVIFATPAESPNNLDVLRRVDLTAARFVGAPIVVTVSSNPSDQLIGGGNQINAGDTNRVVTLAIRELPPGDYAWVESARTAPGTGYYGWIGIRCFSEVAPVFSVAAGEIAIIRVDGLSLTQAGPTRMRWSSNANVHTDATVLADFERARLRYPGLVGIASVSVPRDFIGWPRTEGGSINRNCREPESFERLP